MLDYNRIKEAENNIPTYLEDGKLKKIIPDKKIIEILTQNAKESLDEAEKVQSSLWKIVISYYSMCSKMTHFWHARNS